MKKKRMYKQIQTFKRQGYSQNRIASELEINSRTVSKYFRMDEEEFRAYRRQHMFRDKRFEEYEKDILEVYKMNEFRKLNMSAVYDYLEERHGVLPGNEQTLRNYIGYLIQTEKLRLEEKTRAYRRVPELPYGRQMQLDFGQYRLRSGVKLYIFAALLSASRYKYVSFQGHPFKTTDVIHHLLECFSYFGGVPEEMVIDQDKLMVVSENAGDILYTVDFRYFIDEQGVLMYVCRAADPETKGKVENLIKYIKYSFLEIRDLMSVEEANESVLKWLKRRANGKISQATKKIPAILVESEREKLRPLRNSIFSKDSLLGREERNVNEKARISLFACQYQLPSRYRNKTVEIYVTPNKVFVFDLYTGKEVVSYELSLIPGKVISKREYGKEKEKTSQELKTFVGEMFEKESWRRFVEKNFKTFPRYVRDQCLEAKKYFMGKEVDRDNLEKALEYCLENERSKEPFNKIPSLDSAPYDPLDVRERDISFYKDLVRKENVLS